MIALDSEYLRLVAQAERDAKEILAKAERRYGPEFTVMKPDLIRTLTAWWEGPRAAACLSSTEDEFQQACDLVRMMWPE